MGKSIDTVTGEELIQLVTSETFERRLGKAAQITVRTGHESGFTVFRYLAGKPDYLSPVIEGTTDELPAECSVGPAHSFDLFGQHFHPFPDHMDALCVSRSDVHGMHSLYGERPIRAIGSIGEDRAGYLLLLQRTCRDTGVGKVTRVISDHV